MHFRWVIPITGEERAYAAEHGLEALEQRFEEAGLEYWDPHRGSVIWGSSETVVITTPSAQTLRARRPSLPR